MKTRLPAFITTAALLSSPNVGAQDNYMVSLQLLDSNRNQILSTSSLMSDKGTQSQVSRKSYAITECTETSQKTTKSLKGKVFLTGYRFSVTPKSGIVEFNEYDIDDSKYSTYNKSDCFNEEVKQVEFSTVKKVIVGNKEFQEFPLKNGKILKLAIYR